MGDVAVSLGDGADLDLAIVDVAMFNGINRRQ